MTRIAGVGKKRCDDTALPCPVPATLLEARCRQEWTLFRLPGSKRLSAAAGRKPDLFAPTPVDSNCISGVAKRRLLMG
jgi:hypothetical protein